MKKMSGDLIRLIQAPIIEEQLRTLKEEIECRVAEAESLVCTEETIQTVKHIRADLNKQFGMLEEQRKEIKAAVLNPYQQFENIYRSCVSDPLRRADTCLKEKISAVEATMKADCEQGIRDYFDELAENHHLEFLRFEQTGIVISMADARAKTQPPKRLCEYVSQFIARVNQDMNLISDMEYAEEIMVEYRQTLDSVQAISTVLDRHKRMEQEREYQADRRSVVMQEAEHIKQVTSFAPPTVESQEPEQVQVTFTVVDTLDRLKLLKQFLVSNGYTYN